MVLGELGTKITAALDRIRRATVIDDEAVNACIKEITSALLQADVNVRYVARLRDAIRLQVSAESEGAATNKRKVIQKAVVGELQRMLESERKPYVMKKGRPNVIMFVGLQGSGKTTSCTKYAYYYQRKGWKTSLICADTFRAGAFDQLKQNATRIRVPFYGSYTEKDPVSVAKEGVDHFKDQGFEVIIVDTSGRHRQESALFEEMEQVAAAIEPDEIIFVMDSSIGQSCYDQALAFKSAVKVGSVIVSKLDGHAKGGGALSAVAATESPIIFIGTGEHFDDFEQFEARNFIRRMLGLGDIDKLFSVVQEAVPLDKQPELLNKIQEGKFSLRDMYEQFQAVLNMGPINQVMSMIPGISSSLLEKGREKEGMARIRRFMCMMDSMTDKELDCEKPITQTSIIRIARGSGTSIQEVNILLEEYKRFEKMVKKMGKMNLGKANDMQQFMRNPQQMMRRVQSAVDPKLLKQLGGPGNMMQMMKEMSKLDMNEMMSQLGKGAAGKKKRG
mmetsp:Transcript_7262/g.13455  ORF Transcript_7262/g.13455 Transcript_7262/m.13455 type:complete len:504 (-) Transcript_7262:727-2238(-)